MSSLLLVLFSLAAFVVSCQGQEDECPLKVQTQSGCVHGMYATSRGGRQFMQFLGIPYAKSPTGNLRFKSPVSADPWTGVLNATVECSLCVQQAHVIEKFKTLVLGSEDCLCLNVFTPQISSSKKLPVVVYVHGGGYGAGSSSLQTYGGAILMDKDVVLVSINYRLGVMGFMSTGDDVVPGNFGMKDQVLAFEWVKKNIANFGGDPNSITIFGESAGASSAALHQYSPLSEGLFHQMIADSGSEFCPWAFFTPEVMKGRSAVVASLVGCPTAPSSALLECLQNLPAETIVGTTYKFLIWDLEPSVLWGPTVEPKTVKDAFLTEHPKHSKKVLTKPLLTGFNYAEGGYKTTSLLFGDVSQKFAQWNAQYDTLTPISLMYNNTALDRPQITKAIRKFYFGSDNKPVTSDMLEPITKMYSDGLFTMGVLEAVEKRSGPTFLYYYNYNKTLSFCPAFLQTSPPLYVGACHLDELPNFFPMEGFAPKYDPTNTESDYLLSLTMVDMWTNFIKYSNPSTDSIKWDTVKSASLEHLQITNDEIAMKANPIEDRRKFWKSLQFLTDLSTEQSRSFGSLSSLSSLSSLFGNKNIKLQLTIG